MNHMTKRPEARHAVDIAIRASVLDGKGASHQIAGRCTDLSASGAKVETRDPIQVHSTVMLSSVEFGRIGHATVRYCRRVAMKYVIGLQFSVQLKLADPARGKMLGRATQPVVPAHCPE